MKTKVCLLTSLNLMGLAQVKLGDEVVLAVERRNGRIFFDLDEKKTVAHISLASPNNLSSAVQTQVVHE